MPTTRESLAVFGEETFSSAAGIMLPSRPYDLGRIVGGIATENGPGTIQYELWCPHDQQLGVAAMRFSVGVANSTLDSMKEYDPRVSCSTIQESVEDPELGAVVRSFGFSSTMTKDNGIAEVHTTYPSAAHFNAQGRKLNALLPENVRVQPVEEYNGGNYPARTLLAGVTRRAFTIANGFTEGAAETQGIRSLHPVAIGLHDAGHLTFWPFVAPKTTEVMAQMAQRTLDTPDGNDTTYSVKILASAIDFCLDDDIVGQAAKGARFAQLDFFSRGVFGVMCATRDGQRPDVAPPGYYAMRTQSLKLQEAVARLGLA